MLELKYDISFPSGFVPEEFLSSNHDTLINTVV